MDPRLLASLTDVAAAIYRSRHDLAAHDPAEQQNAISRLLDMQAIVLNAVKDPNISFFEVITQIDSVNARMLMYHCAADVFAFFDAIRRLIDNGSLKKFLGEQMYLQLMSLAPALLDDKDQPTPAPPPRSAPPL